MNAWSQTEAANSCVLTRWAVFDVLVGMAIFYEGAMVRIFVKVTWSLHDLLGLYIITPPRNRGGVIFSLQFVCVSVCLSVCPMFSC